MGQATKNPSRHLILVGALLSANAAADNLDVFNLYASAAYAHDSNLYRLDDSVASAPGVSSRSDTIQSLTAGLRLDKQISQQRFTVDVSASRNDFANNAYLDQDTFQYDALWGWHLSPRVSGILSAAREEEINSFDNYRVYSSQNTRTTLSKRFEADIWARSDWHGLVGLVSEQLSYSQAFQEESDYKSLGWSIGVRYDPGSGRNLAFRYYQRDGDYTGRPVDFVNHLDNAYSQHDYEITLAYPLNDKTRIDGTLAYQDRSHPQISERDYQGWRGQLRLNWQLSGKLGIRAECHRQLDAWQDADSSYATTTGFSVTPQWALTPKQRVDIRLEYNQRQHHGTLPASTGPLREDDRTVLSLAWSWQPTRTTNIGASVRKEHRDSNLPGFDFKATLTEFTAQIMF